ncbi:MAG: hypothetical protein Ct9H90mP27_4850 [Gammaproteobacteria bacterium]|nr:MAG: hypothetical protein Ct9H90mP27_4850 [Gammaproteobacteria bacterium]
MTTLGEQRIGDSVYRIMYDAPMLPEICFKLTLAPILLLTSSALSIYIMQYSYGTVAPEIIWIAIGLIPIKAHAHYASIWDSKKSKTQNQPRCRRVYYQRRRIQH